MKSLSKGEERELLLLVAGPQPAYSGHGNRSRSGVQIRLSGKGLARFLPQKTVEEIVNGPWVEPETMEITAKGLRVLEEHLSSKRGKRQ